MLIGLLLDISCIIIMEDPMTEGEMNPPCPVCGDENWLCDECFNEILAIGE